MVYLNLKSCYFNNIGLHAEISDPSVIKEMESWFSFNISYGEDNSTLMGFLSYDIRAKEKPEEFSITLDSVGIFSSEGIENEDDRKQVHVQAYQLMFGHIQRMVSNLSVSAGLPSIIIETGRMKPDDISVRNTESY